MMKMTSIPKSQIENATMRLSRYMGLGTKVPAKRPPPVSGEHRGKRDPEYVVREKQILKALRRGEPMGGIAVASPSRCRLVRTT
jgi:hypothetical protein